MDAALLRHASSLLQRLAKCAANVKLGAIRSLRHRRLHMKRTDFSYHLPAELIAQRPLERRAISRLLCLDGMSGGLADRVFEDLTDLLRPEDLLIFNDSRVIKARLAARKESGGRVEVLVERVLEDSTLLVQLGSNKPLREGVALVFEGGFGGRLIGRD